MDQCCGIGFVVTSGKSLFLIHIMFHVVELVREAYYMQLINCYKTLKKLSQRGHVRLFATYFKSFYLHQLNSKSNGPVLLLRQYLGIETVFCRLLKQMVKVNMDTREKWKRWKR